MGAHDRGLGGDQPGDLEQRTAAADVSGGFAVGRKMPGGWRAGPGFIQQRSREIMAHTGQENQITQRGVASDEA